MTAISGQRGKRTRIRIALACAAAALLIATAMSLTGCAFNAPAYRGPVSAHFDGERFTNPEGTSDKGLGTVLRWKLTSSAPAWQPREVTRTKPEARLEAGLRATWVGHSTVLLQIDGMNILTDPHWSERASPVSFAGPRRVVAPGINFDDLPRIDVVLISHNHYDHLDVPTLRRLWERDQPRMLTLLGNSALLTQEGIPLSEDLDWWDMRTIGPAMRVTAVPAKHFSARGTGDRDRTLWGGFVIEAPSATTWFSGDTAWTRDFAVIGQRFPRIDLALIAIGSYTPRWFMRDHHIDPAEAVQAQLATNAKTAIGVHWATFPMSDDAQDQPAEELTAALQGLPNPPDFRVLPIGGTYELPPR